MIGFAVWCYAATEDRQTDRQTKYWIDKTNKHIQPTKQTHYKVITTINDAMDF